jgi:Mg2+ and Co2+ transporter CorA
VVGPRCLQRSHTNARDRRTRQPETPSHVPAARAAEVFGLHRLAAEDAVHAHQRPTVERYDDTVDLVLKTVKYIPHESISKARDIVEPARS